MSRKLESKISKHPDVVSVGNAKANVKLLTESHLNEIDPALTFLSSIAHWLFILYKNLNSEIKKVGPHSRSAAAPCKTQ